MLLGFLVDIHDVFAVRFVISFSNVVVQEFVKSEFLSNLGKFKDEVRKCDDIIVKANKTRNIYTLKKEEYNKLLNNNITKGYHKTDGKHIMDINKETQQHAISLRVTLSFILVMYIYIYLLRTHFPKQQPWHRLFNKNTVKLSYSCTINMDGIIKAHNAKILRKQDDSTEKDVKSCNCRDKSTCPVDNKCLRFNVVYKATVDYEDKTESYIGMTENTF